MSRPKEIVCDYLVLETGYTSRLIKTFSDPAKRVIDSVDKVSVVCIKDELWGKGKDKLVMWTEELGLKDMLCDLDGVIVLKLEGSSPFYAAKCFHHLYGSGSAGRYCGFFDGIAESVSTFNYEGLGNVVVMTFDTESG